MLAISALVSAPKRVITPARSQTPRSSSGEPSWLAITPGLRKMPEPITPPTTIMIVVKRPREGGRPGVEERDEGGLAVSTGAVTLKAPNPKIQAPNTEFQIPTGFRRNTLEANVAVPAGWQFSGCSRNSTCCGWSPTQPRSAELIEVWIF